MTPSEVAAAAPYPVHPLEVVTGLMLGQDPAATPLPRTMRSPRQVLEDILLPHVEGGTAVSFSGGRDSSALLAVTNDLARRHGCAPPVAVTLVIPGSEAADEDEWQRLVLEHLGVEQIRVQVSDELGMLGPVAQTTLKERGLLNPSNSYMHVSILEATPTATLVTGAGGDEAFDQSIAGPAAQILLGRRRRPSARDVGVLVTGLLAPSLLRRIKAARIDFGMPWLTGEARELARWLYSDEPPEHLGFAAGLEHYAGSRYVYGLRGTATPLAEGRGAALVHPFLDPLFLSALAREGGRTGLGGRAQAMRRLVGDLLPEPVLSRRSKATFGDAVWTEQTLAALRRDDLLAAVDGDSALRRLVDLDQLRRTWREDQPHFMSTMLMHAAWLATD